MGHIIDYDLNIFRREVEDEYGNWYCTDPWYLDIFIHDGGSQYHFSKYFKESDLQLPIELTRDESKKLRLGKGYFEGEDNWYGLVGFLKDYKRKLSDRLTDTLTSLPEEN